eukprot:2350936-Alexandrium_andersonii.AAC.1
MEQRAALAPPPQAGGESLSAPSAPTEHGTVLQHSRVHEASASASAESHGNLVQMADAAMDGV